MRKFLPCIILLFISFCSNAQLGIIKDPDGFCNVRADASNQSKIEDTLTNGRFVFAFEEGSKNNWLLLDYHKGKQHNTGYIHKSRVVFLKDLTAFKEITVTDTLLKLELNDMQITIKSGQFVKTGRKITYKKNEGGEGQYVDAIDGKNVWGTDGGMPHWTASRPFRR